MRARWLAVAWCGLSFALPACDRDNKDKGSAPATSAASASASVTAAAPLGSAAPGASASAAASDTPPAAAPRARLYGGPALMLVRSASGLELKDDQQAIVDKLEAQLDEDDDAKGAIDVLQQDLIAGVKEGKVDSAALQPRLVAIQKLVQARLEKEAAALNALHAALDASQRTAVTADLRAQQKDREERLAKRDAGTEGAAERSKRRLDRLVKALDLDAAQQAKAATILAALPAPAEGAAAPWKKQWDALLVAFEGAAFDAKKLDAFKPAEAKARVGIDREVQLLAQLVPILKPEQRDVLAARLQGGRQPGGAMMQAGPPHVWPFPFEEEPGTRAFWEMPARGKPPPKRH